MVKYRFVVVAVMLDHDFFIIGVIIGSSVHSLHGLRKTFLDEFGITQVIHCRNQAISKHIGMKTEN